MSPGTTAPLCADPPTSVDEAAPAATTADLRAARLARSLRQEDVARAIGCSAAHYAAIERGDKLPSVEVLAAIAAAFGLERLYRDLAPFVHRAAS